MTTDSWARIAGAKLATQWNAPDLDRGYITATRMRDAQVKALPNKALNQLYDAAEKYAADADMRGIAVTADEWLAVGVE